ncbi:DUF2264 domain-containing protein [Pseudokineococcus sp. 1T1Z-3]|uniref:DUF2264 domain-containing protein n=1 Tax=Pseudokineococcus sp. 1T1Z-3 TaxID=3132745 RepID=UPI00309651F1
MTSSRVDVRGRWEALADELLEALVPRTDASGALVLPPGPLGPQLGSPGLTRTGRRAQSALQARLRTPEGLRRRAANGLEGFARSGLLAAYRLVHADEDRREVLAARLRRGLVAGTTRGGPTSWPEVTDRSQPVVEAALLAMALHHSRPHVWDRLGEAEQDVAARWLEGAVRAETLANNWLLFGVVVERFLAAVGRSPAVSRAAGRLDAVEAMYRGDGWYSDGGERNFDYYGGWGFHLYLVLAALLEGGEQGRQELAVHRERLRLHLEQVRHLVAPDGRPVALGRSLTYRHALLVPFWLGVLLDATPLAPGETREMCSAAVQRFREGGAPDRRGLLPLGWRCDEPVEVQSYSGSASPYWAAKGFLGLLLPPDHPEWTTPVGAPPAPAAPCVRVLPVPGLAVTTTPDAVTRVLNHGLDHELPSAGVERGADPAYDALSFSSRTAPPPPGHGLPLRAVDQLLLRDADGTWHERRQPRPVPVPAGSVAVLASTSRSPCGVVELSSRVLDGGWELRTAVLREGGEACAGVLAGGSAATGVHTRRTSGTAVVVVGAGGLASVVVGVGGWDDAESASTSSWRRAGGIGVPLLHRRRPWAVGEPLTWLVGLRLAPGPHEVAAMLVEARCVAASLA